MDLLQQNQVRVWLSSALAETQRHHFELSRRLPPAAVAQRLRREARRLANSPSAYEQLVRQALAARADHGDRAYRSLALRRLLQAPDPIAQLALRAQVLAVAPARSRGQVVSAVRREERRGGRRGGRDARDLARWLFEAAALHRSLWDHPALNADAGVRGAMLSCAARLETRARELFPTGASATLVSFADAIPTRVLNQETCDGGQPV